MKDTKIGSAVDRGLSGGEVKRTSIVNELMALPRVFLLDEPLTGLDSTRAVEVMRDIAAHGPPAGNDSDTDCSPAVVRALRVLRQVASSEDACHVQSVCLRCGALEGSLP